MKSRLLNLAAGVSLLLAVAIIASWVRSYGRSEFIYRRWDTSAGRHYWMVHSGYGSFDFITQLLEDAGPATAPSYGYSEDRPPTGINPDNLHWFPFPPVRFSHDSRRVSRDVRIVSLAYWLLLPPTLILPAIAFARHRRRRRREAGNLCPTCRYDLRAHNAGDRCPECGMVPASGVLSEHSA